MELHQSNSDSYSHSYPYRRNCPHKDQIRSRDLALRVVGSNMLVLLAKESGYVYLVGGDMVDFPQVGDLQRKSLDEGFESEKRKSLVRMVGGSVRSGGFGECLGELGRYFCGDGIGSCLSRRVDVCVVWVHYGRW